MSIVPNGTWKRSAGVISAIIKNIKLANLKGVKRITVSFDPFGENVKSTREFLFHMSIPKVIDTNPKCILKTNIVCDRSEPTILFDFIPKVHEESRLKSVKIRSANLTTLEILQLLNKHVSSLAPVEEQVRVVTTKASKRK